VTPASARPRFSRDDDGFRQELDRRVADYFSSTARSPHGDWRMHLKTAMMLAWFAGSYAFLLLAATTWWHGALGATSLALAIAGIGFSVQHDANHGAYSRRPMVNRILERTLDMLGASSYLWRWKHNVFHHTYTNVEGADNDIALTPYLRLARKQRRRWIHRFQHFYVWFIYGFTAFQMHLGDLIKINRGRVGKLAFPRPSLARKLEVLGSKVFVLAWAVAIPMLFHPWWVVLAFYAATWFAVGVILGVVFQLAHCCEGSDFPLPDPETRRIDSAWSAHQVTTTADFAPGNRLLTWYVGGLNFQIEHHLFPKVCHVHYPRLAEIVREVCDEFGVRYTSHPSLRAAIASHGRLLRRMGSASACPA
jgi:linoleoyl-CoA desaturase